MFCITLYRTVLRDLPGAFVVCFIFCAFTFRLPVCSVAVSLFFMTMKGNT